MVHAALCFPPACRALCVCPLAFLQAQHITHAGVQLFPPAPQVKATKCPLLKDENQRLYFSEHATLLQKVTEGVTLDNFKTELGKEVETGSFRLAS